MYHSLAAADAGDARDVSIPSSTDEESMVHIVISSSDCILKHYPHFVRVVST